MDCWDDRPGTSSRGGQNQVHHHPTPAGRSRGCVTGKHGGKVFMFRGTIMRGRVTMPIACFVLTIMLPFTATTAGAVSSVASQDGDIALYQDAKQDASPPDATTGDGAEPATADPVAADVGAPKQKMAPASTEEGVEPPPIESSLDTTSNEMLAD